MRVVTGSPVHVALLTGGSDKPYAVGLTAALSAEGMRIDFVGSNELDCVEVTSTSGVAFLNLRGDQRENVPAVQKAIRILKYYYRLIVFAAVGRPRVLHILWNNRFELFDRTALMFYYRLLGKRVVLTAHNINAAKRDGKDGWVNRLSLRIQYSLCHHIFVHTERMRQELVTDFGVEHENVSVIPFGINNTIPTSDLTSRDARRLLNVPQSDRTLLFFGQIAPYKGLDYLVSALTILANSGTHIQLIIAGKIKAGYAEYWNGIHEAIAAGRLRGHVIERIQFIPDDEVEQYFKAADAVVLPYTDIFQSGVPFLAYSFGLPVIATDVGSLRDDVVEGETGVLCPPRDALELARAIGDYFASDLYRQLATRREGIRRVANEKHSWAVVGEVTSAVYTKLLESPAPARHARRPA